MVLGHMKLYPYSRFYLLPIVNQDGEIPVGTGARSRDKIKRAEVFGVIGGFLEEYDIDHIKLPIPQENDHYREEWTRIIVNQTLKDLGEPEHLYMK